MSDLPSIVTQEIAFYAGITSTTIIWFVFTPMLVYQTCTFWRNRHLDYISKRHPILCIFIIISLMIYSMICRPYGYYVDIYYDIPSIKNPPSIFSRQYSIIPVWSILLIVLLLNVRLFSIYYDFRRNQQILSLKWKSQINQTELSQWTLKYQNIFGNVSLLTILNIIWFIIAETMIILTVNNAIFYSICKVIFGLSCFIISIFLLILASRLKDTLGIHQEIISITIIGFIIGLLWVIPSTILNKKSLIRELNSLIILQYGSILIAARMAMPKSDNKIPFYMCIHPRTSTSEQKHQVQKRNKSPNKLHLQIGSNSNNFQTNNLSNNRFDAILNDFDGFEYFAAYLVHEFSVENILYLLEWKQLQIDLISNNLIDNNDNNIWELNINLNILNNVCISHNGIDECYNYMKYIYNKYISNDSRSQINVSWSTQIDMITLLDSFVDRDNTSNELDTNILNRLYMEYEICAQELYVLLSQDSFTRFVKTKEYKNWKNLTISQLYK